MDFDVEQAKKDGYTDEEIQQYLASKQQPVPQDKPINRYEETVGTYTSVMPEAIKYGLEGAGVYGLYKGAQQIFGNKPTPSATTVQQAQPQAMAQQGAQAVNGPRVPPNLSVQQGGMGGPVAPQAPQAPITAPTMTKPSVLDHANSIVRKLALSKILPAAAVGMELFGTSQEEIDTLKKAEALKRAQGWKPLNER